MYMSEQNLKNNEKNLLISISKTSNGTQKAI